MNTKRFIKQSRKIIAKAKKVTAVLYGDLFKETSKIGRALKKAGAKGVSYNLARKGSPKKKQKGPDAVLLKEPIAKGILNKGLKAAGWKQSGKVWTKDIGYKMKLKVKPDIIKIL